MVATIIPGMAIGDRIKAIRQAKGMTQEQLARAADLGLSHIARIEQGAIADPSWSTVRAVAQALGVAITDLEDEEPPAQPEKRGRPKRKD